MLKDVGDASDTIFKPFAALVKEEKATTTKALQTLVDRVDSKL